MIIADKILSEMAESAELDGGTLPDNMCAVIRDDLLALIDVCSRINSDLAEMQGAINDFCREESWGADIWKRQPHVSKLFELSGNKIPVRSF